MMSITGSFTVGAILEEETLFMRLKGNREILEVILPANFVTCIQLLTSRHYKLSRIIGVWKQKLRNLHCISLRVI